MLNVGAGEVIVIALILLIAVGPEQLPGLIRRVGRTVAEVRGMTEGLRSEFMSGLDEIERATDPEAWAAASGPSKVKRRSPVTPDDVDDELVDDVDVFDSDVDDSEAVDGEAVDPEDNAQDTEVPDPEVPDHSGLNSFLKPTTADPTTSAAEADHPSDVGDNPIAEPEDGDTGGQP